MMEVYYYVPANEAANVAECGLKLSRWHDREIPINGEKRKCISALLNPKDDMEKYRSEGYKCLKLQLNPDYCHVADKYLYLAGLEIPEIMDIYNFTVIPAASYIFGSYRLPECLVASTVLSDDISLLNKKLDSPVLFDNSEEFYINRIIDNYKEEHDNFLDTMLYHFFCSLSNNGRYIKYEHKGGNIAVFVDKSGGGTYTFKVPEPEEY